MRALRRAVLAMGLAALAAAIVRVRGRGGTPPSNPSWQEVTIDLAEAPVEPAAADGPSAVPTDDRETAN